jgi:hypothetical protein
LKYKNATDYYTTHLQNRGLAKFQAEKDNYIAYAIITGLKRHIAIPSKKQFKRQTQHAISWIKRANPTLKTLK